MTDTPRTDAVANEIGRSGVDWHHSATLMRRHANELERELATLTRPSNMIPYAYSINTRYDTRVFPTLDAMVRYVIADGWNAAKVAMNPYDSPFRAHVAGEDPQPVDLSPYLERGPVDEAAVRAEWAKLVADSHAEYTKRWPHGRTGPRFSGDHMLCEYSAEEQERLVRREIEARSWRWKSL